MVIMTAGVIPPHVVGTMTTTERVLMTVQEAEERTGDMIGDKMYNKHTKVCPHLVESVQL